MEFRKRTFEGGIKVKDVLKLNIKGIKCDACGWKDDTVRFGDYPKWLNKPCPICGANLLTDADIKTVKKLIRLIEILNNILPKSNDDEKKVIANIDMNGTGKMKFRIK